VTASALAVLPALGLGSNLLVVWFMLRRGVKTSHPSFIWLLFVILFFSWLVSDLALRLVGIAPEAIPWLIPAFLFADISPCIFVLFALSYTRGFHALEREHFWIVFILVIPKVISFVRSVLIVFTFDAYGHPCAGAFGFCDFQQTSIMVLGGQWYFFELAWTFSLFIVGGIILLTPPKGRLTPAYRREIRYIGGGVILLMAVGLPTDIVLPLLIGPVLPGLSSLAIVGMNFVIALGITRRGILLFSPVTEKVHGAEGVWEDLKIVEGRPYVLSKERATAAFKRMVNEGFEGVYVGVSHPAPDIIGTFKKIPVIVIEKSGWGVREEGNIRYVPSTNLRGLSDSILHYARTVKKGVIYLDEIDQILDLGWITPRSALEIGAELSQPRPGMPKITWLYSVAREAKESVELASLFDLPIVKKAVLSHLFNRIFEKSQMPAPDAMRRIDTLAGVDPFFKNVGIKSDEIALAPDVSDHVDLLKLDISNKVRIFLKQFEGHMTPSARADILRGIEQMGLSAYSFIVRGGDAYLLEESTGTRGRGYEILKELVRSGYLGLCISRTEPTKLAERYAFEPGTLVYWLTGERRGEKDLKPAPEYLVNHVKSFVDESAGRNGVILLDGLEFLITFSGDQFDPYLKALRRISDLVAQSHTVFVVVYDSEVFPPERVALIRRSGFEDLPASLELLR